MTIDAIEGTTLSVYAFIVRSDEPVGVRDVTRGAELSSTSVAHRHLQKLETLGLIEKNNYGYYTLRKKTSIEGHMWVGKNLVPRLMIYSYFFMGAFAAEISMILASLVITSVVIDMRFLFLMGITFVGVCLFLIEGVMLQRKLSPKRVKQNQVDVA